MVRRFLAFLAVSAVVWAMACGLSYLEVQQVLRGGANDPQVQLAEDGSAALNGGAPPTSIVGTTSIDIAASLAPWVTAYDESGAVLVSDATLNGQAPQIPAGVRAAATAAGRDQVTWEPQSGVRIALVVVPFNGGTVASGRSLRQVEQRVDQAQLIAGVAVVVGLVVVATAAVVAARIWPDGVDSGASG